MAETTGRQDLHNCLQSLYPGEIITLIEIDGTKFGARVYRLHGENIRYTPEELLQAQQTGILPPKEITFRGEQYGARPFGITGINFTSNGKADKPQLILSNLDSQVSAMIRNYNGMMQAKVTIYVIPAELLGEDGNIKDGAFRRMVYYIERPSQFNRTLAKFDLTSPYDMDGIMIPPRVTQSVCYWAQRNWYRSGKGCSYNGSRMFDKDNNPVTDPSQDFCAGTVNACKLRFGAENELDFGGAPVASLLRRNQ
ncbi:minor tail protein [Escherichia phage Jahat_MG145]|uniref:Minor tail protein n=1 Tax=Escherichia phage Jahat_MG145 TaxID=2562601 RepID=A0A4D6DYK0_9CAUD|nr:minor tail protein [Escherichia phage Jahat_MG145]QGH77331.1 minor tail protein [Escherichia phage BEBK14]